MDFVQKETICQQIIDMKDQTEFMKQFRLALGSALDEIQHLRKEIAVLKQENNISKKLVTTGTQMQKLANFSIGEGDQLCDLLKESEIHSCQVTKPEIVLEKNSHLIQQSEITLNKLANHVRLRNERVKVMSQRLAISNTTLLKRERKLEEKLKLVEDYKQYTSKLENEISRLKYLNDDTVGKLRNEQQRSLSKDTEIRFLKNQAQYLKHEADKMYYKIKEHQNYPNVCTKCKAATENINDSIRPAYSNNQDTSYNMYQNPPISSRKVNRSYQRTSPMKGFRNIPILSPITEEQSSSIHDQDIQSVDNKIDSQPGAKIHINNKELSSDRTNKESSFTYFDVKSPNLKNENRKSPNFLSSQGQQNFHQNTPPIFTNTPPNKDQVTLSPCSHQVTQPHLHKDSPVKYNPSNNNSIPNHPNVLSTDPQCVQVESTKSHLQNPQLNNSTAPSPTFKIDSSKSKSSSVNNPSKNKMPINLTTNTKTISAVPRNISLLYEDTSSDTSMSSCSSSKSGRKISKRRKKSAKYITFHDHRINVTKFTMNDFKDIMWGVSAAGIPPKDFLRFLAEHAARLNDDVTWSKGHSLGKPEDWLSLEDCY